MFGTARHGFCYVWRMNPEMSASSNRVTYRSTLEYALALAGSDASLAARLNVPIGKVRLWLDGIEDMPDAIFLAAVDVIIASTPAEIARCREAMLARH